MFKKLLNLAAPLLVLAECAAQSPSPSAPAPSPAPAAVAVNRGKDGAETYFIFGTGATGKLEDLPAELARSGYHEADLSAWSGKIDYAKLLSALKAKGISVPRCYVPEPARPPGSGKTSPGPNPRSKGNELSSTFAP